MRALVIDDARAARWVIEKYLSELSFEVRHAENGRDGLELLTRETFDLAVVDWNMPVMDGLAFVRAIREVRDHDAMLVMMVTTESEASHVGAALTAGANGYLLKPFSQEALAKKLASSGLESQR